jgi:hypothetical protein
LDASPLAGVHLRDHSRRLQMATAKKAAKKPAKAAAKKPVKAAKKKK